MKTIPCKIVINNRWGYVYTPVEFPSVNQAYIYGREYYGGFAFRIFSKETGKLIKRGFCASDL
jgi:hypothetical protein